MSVQSWFNEIWYDDEPRWWLLPLSAIYGAASAVRRRTYERQWRRSTRLSRPVIVVGNLSVGGTGKTPLVCWLAAQLKQLGFTPGVVTRGYRGSSQAPRLVVSSDDPALVGDEPLLLARRTQGAVAIGRDRPAASQLLIDAGCDVIVSDDGLQHHALARDCEIAVVDGDRGFGNGRLLPAGPLRETPARLSAVDAIVINGGPGSPGRAKMPRAVTGIPGALRMRLTDQGAVALIGAQAKPLREFSGRPVHAVAAIGNPERFFTMLRAQGLKVIAHPLPDHARLRVEDIVFADEHPVLMTEKDAVKCAKIAGRQHWYVPVGVTFDAGGPETLLGIVTAAIARDKRS